MDRRQEKPEYLWTGGKLLKMRGDYGACEECGRRTHKKTKKPLKGPVTPLHARTRNLWCIDCEDRTEREVWAADK